MRVRSLESDLTDRDHGEEFGETYWRKTSISAGVPRDLTPASLDDAAFRMLADNIPTLCWLANGDGYIVWYNRRWHEYCGTTPEQMEGWGWQSVHDPEVLPDVVEKWTRSIAEGSPFEMTFPLLGADGRFRPFLTRIQPMRSEDGKVIRWFGVNTDVSRQVAAYAALEASQSSLTMANEEIQRFAYIVSHDLRAPLVNVLGFTSELDAIRAEIVAFVDEVAARTPELGTPELVTPDLRTAVDNDLPEALGFIRASTQKMDRLISAILKLSREGRRRLTPEPIDMGALVAVQGETLAQQLAARDATLRIDGDLPPLVSDRLAIEQVFGNLIENAVKYLSPERPGLVVIKGRKEGSWLTYDIVDNGRGIDDKDFERVFELFRRSGEQNTRGEGIGLAYVRNLARRLGGFVTVRSVLDEGSTFSVRLPVVFQTVG